MLNSKNLKNIICLTILVIVLLSITSFAIVSQTKDFFVNDYADVLTEETKNYIMQTNIELQQKTGAQIVVVTIESLDGIDIEEYSIQLARKFEIGDSEKNNGILLLCSTGDRKFRIEVGYGLEGRLTDGKTGKIQDEYIIPYLKNNNYDEGIKNGFNAILQEVANEYNVTIINSEVVNDAEKSDEYSFSFYIIVFLDFFIILCICISKYKQLSIKISKFKIIYMCILAIIGGIFTKSFVETILLLVSSIASYGIIYFIIIANSNRDYNDNDFGGSSEGGGYSGGGGSFRWWRKY